jgi:hypothetical protein
MMAASATVAVKKQIRKNKRLDAADFMETLPPLKSRKHDINVEMLLNG